MRTLLTMLTLALTFGLPPLASASDEITCHTDLVRRRISSTIYVLERQVSCYPTPNPAGELIKNLRAACDLLLMAHGEREGRTRCRNLIDASSMEHLGL